VRNFAKTLAVMGVLTPAGVNALGVGEIKLHSALNQRLLAEIPLLTSAGEDVSQIQVRLAPSRAFAQAGLDLPYYLANLRFKPLRKPDGSVVIQVTSTDVIREPFLDFLVEVEWPQGRMLREFTVLLDPPVTYDDAVRVAQSPPGVTPPPVRSDRAPADTRPRDRLAVYGPVKPKESLWNIAQRLKPEAAVTTEQMVMALYRENPDAFLDGNVNALKAGVTLKVPGREKIVALSPRQARREFQQHYRDWMARRSTAGVDVAAAAGEPKAQLQLEAPAEQAGVSGGQAEMPVIEGPDTAAPETEEALEALRAENQALKARLESLEKRMAELIELHNATLARLQKESREQKSVSKAATVPPDAEPKPSVAAKPESRITEPKRAPQPAEENGLLAGLLDSPIYLSLGGGSLFLLAVAGFLIWRRRQAADEQADSLLVALDSEPADEGTEALGTAMPESDSQVSGVPSAGVEVSESSFLSEFTPSDFDILETDSDAVDPIAEADVYLAYGRYQQAEELIRQALAERPDDPALRLKLLEIHYANENRDAYLEYARELQAAGADRDAEFWSKVVEMARELGLDDALSVGDSAPDSQAMESPSQDVAVDFDLARQAPDSGEAKDAAEPAPAATGLPDLDPKEAGDAGAVEEAIETAPEEAQDFSFDFTPSQPAEEDNLPADRVEPSASSSDDEGGLDFDLGGIELPKNEPAASSAAEESEKADGLEFTLSDEAPAPDSTDADFDPTDMDEADTKLDLARAYVDMEDADSAKEILEEVLAQGNERQKQEAQRLLNQLGVTSSS